MWTEALFIGATLCALMGYQQYMARKGRTVTASHRRWTVGMMGHLCLVLLLTGGVLQHALNEMGLSVLTVGWIRPLLLFVLMTPLGFFVPHIWHNFSSLEEVGAVGNLFAILVEFAQLPMVKSVSLDDVWMGTLGTIMGFVYWREIGQYRYYGHGAARTVAFSCAEPLIDVVKAVCCNFFFYKGRLFL